VTPAPHFNSISRFLESAELTPVLKALIAESALPLKAVEVDFAVDSSGFTSSRFVRWFDHKYGVVKQEHTWVKVHLICGVKTNVVTAVRIGGKNDNDCPEFIPLVNATAERFTIREVSADKQYLSYDNMDAVAAHGGTPYIAFKEGSTGGKGGTYGKMYHYYNLNKDDFLSRYHKRSNVESTFAMIKGKFGDSLRSKTDTAMVNEALCKILCHNICCLNHSARELGIEAAFWDTTAAEPEPEAVENADDLVLAMAWV
ncbi:MAG: transposase, partial [Actinobacteria bacterium]|nr:transposase [Actinomycetota bacterium]